MYSRYSASTKIAKMHHTWCILLDDTGYTVEPPNKGHFGNGALVLCSEVVPISEVPDFSTHFDCIILNKLINALKCMIRAVEMIIKWLVCYQHSTG